MREHLKLRASRALTSLSGPWTSAIRDFVLLICNACTKSFAPLIYFKILDPPLYVVVPGSTWRTMEWYYTPRNSHIDPVTATR